MQIQSNTVNCPILPKDYIDNYVFETIHNENECCKQHKTTGCKVEGRVYRVGETWPSPDGNKCKNFTCIDTNGQISKQESVETCKTDCSLGWEYKDSKDRCCGQCVQKGCLLNGELKQKGENWTSSDNCTVFTCEFLGDQFTVSSQQEACPSIDDCPEENIFVKGCCKQCNVTTLSNSKFFRDKNVIK